MNTQRQQVLPADNSVVTALVRVTTVRFTGPIAAAHSDISCSRASASINFPAQRSLLGPPTSACPTLPPALREAVRTFISRVVNFPATRELDPSQIAQAKFAAERLLLSYSDKYIQRMQNRAPLITCRFSQDLTSSPGLLLAGQAPPDAPLYPSATQFHTRCAPQVWTPTSL